MALDLDCGVVDHLLIACPVQGPCWVQAVCLHLGPGKFFPMAEWPILQFPSPGSCSQKPLGDGGNRGTVFPLPDPCPPRALSAPHASGSQAP